MSAAVESCAQFLSHTTPPLLSVFLVMTIGSAAIWYLTTSDDGQSDSDRTVRPYTPLDDQSVLLPGDEQSRISRLCVDGRLMTYLYDDVRTVYDILSSGMRRSNNGQCLGRRRVAADSAGRRPYTWQVYSEVIEQRDQLASFLVAKLGLQPGQQTFVGIYSRNRPEWIVCEHATYVYSMVNVPLYDTLGPEAVYHIVRTTEMPLVVCENADKVQLILDGADQLPLLRYLVVFEPCAQQLADRCTDHGLTLLQWVDCLSAAGGDLMPARRPPTPEDLATICYTSGTTDLPKGVMLSHGNIIAGGTVERVFVEFVISETDTLISYLPLAHMFERLMETCVLMKGGRVGYYSGDVRQLTDDMVELQPTLMPTVPRLINRVYDKVMMEVGRNAIKKLLFDAAMRAKLRDISQLRIRNNGFWDWLVLRPIRRQFGGRLRVVISGSAPASTEVLTFCRAVMGCIVAEGYGQTECVAAATLTVEGESVASTVGPPMPGNMIKLVDVLDMNYLAKDGCGEVCIKGANVFCGYFKDADRTAETLDPDGWLHTGDIGRWTPSGALQLIDRKKHIFKLAQGEYVAPDKVESVYAKCPFVAQVFVHGDSLKSSVVGIVVPDMEVLRRTLGSDATGRSDEEIVSLADVKQTILLDMQSVGKKAKLCSFEQVKDIHLTVEPFSIENNLLTPTYKSKRLQLKQRFQQQIDRMYEKLA